MPSHRVIKAVLHNFLGTYTSRYSSYNGYWLFGYLYDRFERIEFDLLQPSTPYKDRIIELAEELARRKFAEQAKKASISTRIVAANLAITKDVAPMEGQVNSHLCSGYQVYFDAMAQSDKGQVFRRSVHVFVTSHSPWREHRSAAI